MNGYQGGNKANEKIPANNNRNKQNLVNTGGPSDKSSEKPLLTEYNTEIISKNSQVTTTQLRKILSFIIQIANEIKMENPPSQEDQISPPIKRRLRRLVIMLVYQGAREPSVRKLVDKLELIKKLQGMTIYKEFHDFHDEFEEIVAFAKYHKE